MTGGGWITGVALLGALALGCTGQRSSPPHDGGARDGGARTDGGASVPEASTPRDGGRIDSRDADAPGRTRDAAADPDGDAPADAGLPTKRVLHHTEFPMHGVALFHNVNIYSEPNSRSPRLGVLRRGTRVRLGRALEGRGCREGRWHPIQPAGYICSGRTMRVDEEPPPLAFAPTPARLDAPTPYDYGRNRLDRAPLYRRPPTSSEYAAELERRRLEREARRAAAAGPPDGGTAAPEQPAATEETEEEEEEEDEREDPALGPIVTRLQRGFYVTVERIIIENGRRWVRTSGLNYVEAPAIFRRAVPELSGAELGADLALPIVITARETKSRRVEGDGRIGKGRDIPQFTSFPLLGTTKIAGKVYYSVGDGELVSSDRAKRIEPIDPPPAVGPDERWIDVDLSEQTLVAYEGARPVFATLVSTGKQGHATPTGAYRIHSKYVSCDMSETTDVDEPYLIEDVPWTMYFHLAIALHGAFWHSQFGRERSHGCVNLAPADARRLFWWVGPDLPEGWHGVVSTEDNPGTRVFVRR